MEDQLVTKFIKISLKDQSFALSADVGEINDAIQTAFATIRIENCVKFDAAGTAMCVVGKALIHKWEWIRSTSIEEDNTLKIEIPRDKENAFKNLMKDGKLQREAKESLEDAETNLGGILGRDAFGRSGEKILELIKNIQVSKVEEVDGGSDSKIAALNVTNCTWQRHEENVTNIAVDISDGVSGNVAAMAAEGCTVTGSAKGNTNVAIKANNADEAGIVIRSVRGAMVRVQIWSELFDKDFIADFDGSEVIRNVRKALEEARPNPGRYTIVRGDGVAMDEDTETVGHAALQSSALGWKAFLKSDTGRKRKSEEISCADARGEQEEEADNATRPKTSKSNEPTQGTRKIVIEALGRRNKRVKRIPRGAESFKIEKPAIIADNAKYYSKSKKEAEDEYTKVMPLAFEDPSKQPLSLLSYDDLKDLLKQATPLRIGIAAAAGYGKTTLLQRLERDLSKSEKLVVMFLSFHHISNDDKTSPRKLFFDGLFQNEEQREQCYEWILKNQVDVIFLLDGLDQAEFSLKSKTKHVEDYGEGSTSEIISNLLSKDLFPDSKVVYSSREYAMSSLEGALRPDKVISIIGLKRDDSKDLFIDKLGENGKDLWNKMEVSLKPLLRIPAFLTFTIRVYKAEPENPPSTLTEVMQRLYQKFVHSEHSQCELTKTQITALRKLCYLGLKNKKLMFKRKDFKAVGLDLDLIKDFVIIVPGHGDINYRLLDGDKVAIFSHQTIQEFFASEHIVEMDIDDFSRTVEQDLTSDYWLVITRFVAGLLLNKKSKLENFQISKLNEKQGILRHMLASKYGEGQAVGGEVASKLSILASIAETEDSDFIQFSVKNIELANHPIGINGMSSIASVMRHCNHLVNLKLCNCALGAEEAQLLWENVNHSQVKVDNLNVARNYQLGDGFQYICKLSAHCNVLDLYLGGCHLQDCHLSWLKEINPSQLKDLMIDGSVMSSTEMGIVGKNMKECRTISDTTFASIGNSLTADCGGLFLSDYVVTLSGLRSLKTALNEKKISRLDITECTLNADCCELIGKIVKQCGVDELKISNFGTSNAISRFLEIVNETKISYLNLSYNDFDADCCEVVAKIVKQCLVENLKLASCKIDNDLLDRFLTSAKGVKISSLDFSFNYFDADCCEVVANIVMQCSIEKLYLRYCGIDDDALDRFLTSTKGVKLEKLNVKGNCLSSAAIRRIRERITVDDLYAEDQVLL